MRSSTVRLATQLLRTTPCPSSVCSTACSSTFSRSINTNKPQQNTAATFENNLNNQSDKCIHYSNEEGYIKTSAFENTLLPNCTLDKYVWRDFKLWENNVATVSGRKKEISI